GGLKFFGFCICTSFGFSVALTLALSRKAGEEKTTSGCLWIPKLPRPFRWERVGVRANFHFASSTPCKRESTAWPSPAHEVFPPSSWEPPRPFALPGQPQSRSEPPPSAGRLTLAGGRRTRRGLPESFHPA